MSEVSLSPTPSPTRSPASAPEIGLSRLDTLPTIEPIAIRLLQVASSADSSASDLVELLRADQALVAKVLSVANSPATGARERVATIDRAVVLLGFTRIRSLALAVKIFRWFSDAGTGDAARLNRPELWRHTLAVACAARRLAAALPQRRIEPEEAFVAGLLHDLGKIALDAVFPKAYARIVALADQTRGAIADCERNVLGIDHTVAGRHIAERWGLPRSLSEVIWLHHLTPDALPSSVSCPTLISIVQLADVLAREQRLGYSGNFVFYESAQELAGRLGLGEPALQTVVRDLVRDVAAESDLLGIESQSTEQLYFGSVLRANEELGRLNTELVAKNRQLAAAARYFAALTSIDQHLTAWSDMASLVAAIAQSAVRALQRDRLAVFGIRDTAQVVDVCWLTDGAERIQSATQSVPDDVNQWRTGADWRGASVFPLPPAVRAMLGIAPRELGEGECWLLPIVYDGAVAGGIVYASSVDEPTRLTCEQGELRAFLSSVALAIARVNAQASVRRLSDDLAETNRRLQQMRSELLRSRTLSMIAEMAAGAGHELNSPLTVISGRAQMLQDVVTDPELHRSLEMIHRKAHECSQIVSELMDFAQPLPPSLSTVDVAELLDSLCAEWRQQPEAARAAVQLVTPAAPRDAKSAGGASVLVDRGQIRTVLFELLRNASDAVAERAGSIWVTWRVDLSADSPAPAGPPRETPDDAARAVGLVEITVRDNGCGMSQYVLQRAFDPFFSHRRAGRRRGLGLPRAHRVIEAHGGQIWLESQVDEGTTAHVLLPLARPAQ